MQRASSAAGSFTTVAMNLTGTGYTDTGLNPGTTYHYVVTALRDLAESANSAVVSATPLAPLSPVQSWRDEHFGTPEPTGPAADDADPDADGVVNLLEYALGGDPLVANPAILPVASSSADHLALTFTRMADPELTYRVQAVADLDAAWSDIWSSTGEENTEGPVTVTDPVPLSTTPRRFLRLEVTAP